MAWRSAPGACQSGSTPTSWACSEIVADDRAVVRLHFTGHFRGHFQELNGDGRAIDVYRVEGGRIAENRHLEDNLTLLTRLGKIA